MAHHKVKKGELIKAGRVQVLLDTFYARNEPTIIRTLDATTRLFLRLRARPVLRLLSRMLGVVFSTGEVVTTERALRFIDAISVLDTTEIAVGPCMCQKALNRRKGSYLKDMVVLYGAEAYKHAYPAEYEHVTPERARALLREFHDEGLIPTFFACLRSEGWIYAICNCESEICFPFRAHQAAGAVMYAGPDTVELNLDGCIGCGTCVDRCHFAANTMVENRSRVDLSRCYGCGLCVATCQGQARTMMARQGYRRRYYPLDLVGDAAI
ncbi:MAG: 4Fe-4S dicluster domain-containing protein [Dehalococcoidia bacterium]|nr:4Fe-4S dicluster domain-containing protein [Dehalococcoidia bacterium]